MPYKWIPVAGTFTVDGEVFTFKGGSVPQADGRLLFNVGNFVCDQYFGGGKIEGYIEFTQSTEHEACEFMLYYHPPTRNFITAGLGSAGYCTIRSWIGTQWINHAVAGDRNELQVGRKYKVVVRAVGSRVSVSVDDVVVLATNLPGPLPTGQVGIWCTGGTDVKVTSFSVTQEKGRVFVVMQFSDQFNELYRDVIAPVCRDLGLNPIRADEVTGPGIILADIVREIVEAKIIVADITPANPNVYYEVGYAHALNKPTILVAEKPTQLPFDVSPFRVLFNENTIGGKARIEAGLRKHMEAIQLQWSIT